MASFGDDAAAAATCGCLHVAASLDAPIDRLTPLPKSSYASIDRTGARAGWRARPRGLDRSIARERRQAAAGGPSVADDANTHTRSHPTTARGRRSHRRHCMRPALTLLLLLALASTVCIGARRITTTIISRCLLASSRMLRPRPQPQQPLLFLLPHHHRSTSSRTMGRKQASAAPTAAAAVKTEGGLEGGWIDLGVPPHELRPEFSLNMGQCFNWKRRLPPATDPDGGGGLKVSGGLVSVGLCVCLVVVWRSTRPDPRLSHTTPPYNTGRAPIISVVTLAGAGGGGGGGWGRGAGGEGVGRRAGCVGLCGVGFVGLRGWVGWV